MSKVEVNQVTQQCGTTLTVGGGACKTAVVDATTVTLGRCGGTVSLASGAPQSGFGRTGTVNWNTTKITADPANAVSGTGYFCDTSGGAFTVTLPTSPSAGDIVAVSDYTRTFGSNNLTIGRNSKPIGGIAGDGTLSTNGQSATFVFVDDTEGWINIQETQTSQTGLTGFIMASGGTPASGAIVCTDYKQHTFTGPGTFCVSAIANCAADNLVSYMVIAGGGAGGKAGDRGAGGGGAGGFRELVSPTAPYTASPLDGYPVAPNRITVTATGFPITVGAGAAARCSPNIGNSGSTSTFSTIDSAGGGGGGGESTPVPGATGVAGGSGGGGGKGGGSDGPGGAGNTPPVSPPQGNAGASGGGPAGSPGSAGGGGGGATAVGVSPPGGAAHGGAGATTSINGTPTAYAGGGGGSIGCGTAGSGGTGGGGAGGTWTPPVAAVAGTANSGGGGGGGNGSPQNGGAGGSGVVIIRYKFQ